MGFFRIVTDVLDNKKNPLSLAASAKLYRIESLIVCFIYKKFLSKKRNTPKSTPKNKSILSAKINHQQTKKEKTACLKKRKNVGGGILRLCQAVFRKWFSVRGQETLFLISLFARCKRFLISHQTDLAQAVFITAVNVLGFAVRLRAVAANGLRFSIRARCLPAGTATILPMRASGSPKPTGLHVKPTK